MDTQEIKAFVLNNANDQDKISDYLEVIIEPEVFAGLTFNAINKKAFSTLTALSADMRIENVNENTITTFIDATWDAIYRSLPQVDYASLIYERLSDDTFEQYFFESYFRHISPDEWLSGWLYHVMHKTTLIDGEWKNIAIEPNFINDETQLSYEIYRCSPEKLNFIISHSNDDNLALIGKELVRSTLAKQGCRKSIAAIIAILSKKPNISKKLREHALPLFNNLSKQFFKYTYVSDNTLQSMANLSRCHYPDSISYCAYMIHCATSSMDEFIQYLNKSSNPNLNVMTFLCDIHGTTPDLLMYDPRVTPSGITSCLKIII